MNLITKKNLICSAYRRFRSTTSMTNKAIAIYTQLEQLDDTSTEEDVTRIVGNDSLTRIECSECGESVSEAVAVGDGYLCGGCVQRAVEIFTQRKG